MIEKIRKRDGREAAFDDGKIKSAISKVLTEVYGKTEAAEWLTGEVVRHLEKKHDGEVPGVEEIQEIVEDVLIWAGLNEAAKAYIRYRASRTQVREMKSSLMNIYSEITFKDASENDLKRENANIDGDTAMGTMLRYGSEGAKHFNEIFILRPEQAQAHRSGDIHIHDMDFLTLTTTCCQIDLRKLFAGGFGTGHGTLREPSGIKSAASLACIAIQSNQNDQHGGQSIPAFDYYLAPYVKKTYERKYAENLERALRAMELSGEVVEEAAKELAEAEAEKDTEEETYQAMEALVHNLNTMHSRAGAQVPFSSLNYGTDTSKEGRLVTKSLLLAIEAGLGHGETAIFPVSIFKVKEGVNYNPGDPNYDLFELACKVSAKRLFPNFAFIDAPFNLKYYRAGNPDTEIAYMGCRTRVIGNVYDPEHEIVTSRGNLSFTSINLPRLAIESKGSIEARRNDEPCNSAVVRPF